MFERLRRLFSATQDHQREQDYEPEDILQGLTETQILALYSTYIEDTLPLYGENADGARESD